MARSFPDIDKLKKTMVRPLLLQISIYCYLSVVFFFFSYCNDIRRPPIESIFLNSLLVIPGAGLERVGVVTSDFGASGKFAVINPDAQISIPTIANIHSDAVAKFIDGKVFIINRLNRDSILVLNPALGFLPESDYSVGKGNNPQDIVKVNENKAYISLYNSRNLLVVNPYSGAFIKNIDLGMYAETTSLGIAGPDGIPETNQMYLDGTSLYIQLQRLDRNDPAGIPSPNSDSLLLELDVNTDSILQTYIFKSRNPTSKIQKLDIAGESFLVMCTPNRMGFISKLDGGIVAFSLKTKTFRNDFLYSETTAGGDILGMQIKNETEGYASVLDSSFNKFIQQFNPSTGQRVQTILSFSSSAGNISGLLLTKSGRLYVGDGSFSRPGVLIFDTTKVDKPRLTQTSIDVGLRPFDLVEIQ
jgi:hypothetical protein